MTVTTPAAPPLPSELDALLRRLRMPYVRKAAPEVIATATAQRWEPAEVLRVLLAEEAAGRDRATIQMRRRQSALPAGPRQRICGHERDCASRRSSAIVRAWTTARAKPCAPPHLCRRAVAGGHPCRDISGCALPDWRPTLCRAVSAASRSSSAWRRSVFADR